MRRMNPPPGKLKPETGPLCEASLGGESTVTVLLLAALVHHRLVAHVGGHRHSEA